MTTYAKSTLERIEFAELKPIASSVPLIVDDWTLAFRLGFRGKSLWYAILNRDNLYQKFKLKKKSGGLRIIHNPKPIMRVVSAQLRARILLPLCAKLGFHVGAYQIGTATRDTARRHLLSCPQCAQGDAPHTCTATIHPRGDSYTLKRAGQASCPACQTIPPHKCPRRGVKIHMDLKDFFGSTRRSWIRAYFHDVVGYNYATSSLLAHLFTVKFENGKQGVPQGAIASGDICNLIADTRLDKRILDALPDWQYSRYADDLYFSHPENLPKGEVQKVIGRIHTLVKASGYQVNFKKLYVQRSTRQQKVLGIVINQKLNIPRTEYRKFRSLLNNCIKTGFKPQLKRAGKTNVQQMKSWLLGKLAYFQSIAPERADKLRLLYNYALLREAA